MNARDEILANIRRATGGASASREADYASIQRDYHARGQMDATDRVHLFMDRLHDYDAFVHRCSDSEISAAVEQALNARDKRSLLIPPSLPSQWLPGGFEFIPDHGLSFDQIDRSEGVLTGCAVAIAVTGTIVLQHAADQARRALTLIPDYHLCVVFENQIVETVPAGIHIMVDFAGSPITTISGPSATADIEMTRIKGVHGPRTLEVIIVASGVLNLL